MIDLLTSIPPLWVVVVVGLVVGVESIGVPLPGEAVLIAATLLATQGVVAPWWVALAAMVGAVVGDSVGYALGRRHGVRLLAHLAVRFPHHLGQARQDRAVGLVQRWGALAVFAGRFVALLRVLAGPLAGSLHMPYPKFLVANVTGGVVWAGGTVTAVYLLGDAAITALHDVTWGALVVLAVALVVLLVVLRVRRRRARTGTTTDATTDPTGTTAGSSAGPA
ncbi:DedA family protein [Rhodococcus aerolatus]